MEQTGQFDLGLWLKRSDSVFEIEDSHHEDAHEDVYSSVSERKFSNGSSSMEESISDQLKRDDLVEGSAVDGLDKFQHDCLIAKAQWAGLEGILGAEKTFLKGDPKLKEKTKPLAGDDGGATGAVIELR